VPTRAVATRSSSARQTKATRQSARPQPQADHTPPGKRLPDHPGARAPPRRPTSHPPRWPITHYRNETAPSTDTPPRS